MTAKEEDILTNQNFIKNGTVINKLLQSLIVTPINYNDLLIGDKNAIVLATRILGYGPEYKIKVPTIDGQAELSIDLAKVKTKEVDLDKLSRNNVYEWVSPFGKNVIKFKLLTHGDEKKIDADVRAVNRLNKDGASAELTTRYRYMIKSVDGKEDTKSIVNFVNNKFLTRDTKAFREHIKDLQPDMKMEFEYDNPNTGEKEMTPIPMGVGFFWPS